MRTRAQFFVSIAVSIFLMMSPLSAAAKNASPFLGEWLAVDVDGGDIRLKIAGPANGPFKITWSDSYDSLCQGGAGLGQGIGWLNAGDPLLLEAYLLFQCPKSKTPTLIHAVWRYDSETDTIAYPEPDPVLLTWYRRGTTIPAAQFQVIAHTDEDWVEGMGYTEGTAVSLQIRDAQQNLLYSGVVVAGYREDDPETVRTEFFVGYDLQPGDHLWMTDGRTAKDLIASNIAVSAVNQVEMTISGTAEPGSEVIIEFPTESEYLIDYVTTSPDGTWTRSIAGMLPATWGLVSQEDADHDLTRVVFYLPFTRFTVFPQWEWFDGIDWPDGALVSISVDGKPECAVDRESWGSFFNGNFGEGCDVQFGDRVVFTDGSIWREHTVRTIAVTDFDLDQDIVYGQAEPDTAVTLWLNENWDLRYAASADASGDWSFSLVGIHDLVPVSSGMAESSDPQGNATWIDWHVPDPRIVANLDEDWIHLIAFPSDAAVDVVVYDAPGGTALWTSTGLVVDGYGDGWIDIDIADSEDDLIPGMFITVTDGTYIRELTLEALTFDQINLSTGHTQGTAPGADRNIWIGIGFPESDPWTRDVKTDGYGNWTAEFEAAVPVNYFWVAAQLFDEDGDATEVRPTETTRISWQDDFNGPLDEAWQSRGSYSFDELPGFLRMAASSTGSADGNWLLRPVWEGDFSIETRVLFEPNNNYQFAGLLLWQDEENFIQFGRAFCSEAHCVGNGIYFDRVSYGGLSWNEITGVSLPGEAYLRLEKRGNEVRAYFSQEGITWTEVARDWPFDGGFQINAVGVVSSQNFFTPDVEVPADFDYFVLSEGFNFLPYGYHDYEAGVQNSWNCAVGGWTADPDDPLVDLNVEFSVDGTLDPDWLTAGIFRPDLFDASVCGDGNCAFDANIFDSLTPDVPHDVAAFAQDYPTGDWVLLENSPKSLTCVSD